jgi:glycine/D-amino acid oxidase-like deaminating enzyme
VLVVGAGVVGMACARALQNAGRQVLVVDPEPPGAGCSLGNAGVIATEHVLPMARFAVLRRVPAMLLDRHGPLYLKMRRLPGLLPWFARFALAARPSRVDAGARAIAALTGRALPAWRTLLGGDGAGLLKLRGLYTVYRSVTAFERDAAERAMAAAFGVPWEVLDGPALRAREGALSSDLVRAVWYPEVAHVTDPQGVVRHLHQAYQAAGGRWLPARVGRLIARADCVIVEAGDGVIRAHQVVLAAGLGSRALCAGLGVAVPLVAEMGYHVAMPGAEERLSAPVSCATGGFIVTPMTGHLRAAGTVEFARHEAEPAWHRAQAIHDGVVRLFRDPLPEPSARWRGSRPTLPDFLPAIGTLPGHPRVLAAFGHQHIGLTTAAVTAEVITALASGRTPDIDLAPYDPGRFR